MISIAINKILFENVVRGFLAGFLSRVALSPRMVKFGQKA
jgi:hypothetical protein